MIRNVNHQNLRINKNELKKTAEVLIEIKKNMDELNQEYLLYRNRMLFISEMMIKTKQAVKKYQVVYWSHPEIRDSLDYKYSYIAISDVYDEMKKSYKTYCNRLNQIKKQIKDRQRQISKINCELRDI